MGFLFKDGEKIKEFRDRWEVADEGKPQSLPEASEQKDASTNHSLLIHVDKHRDIKERLNTFYENQKTDSAIRNLFLIIYFGFLFTCLMTDSNPKFLFWGMGLGLLPFLWLNRQGFSNCPWCNVPLPDLGIKYDPAKKPRRAGSYCPECGGDLRPELIGVPEQLAEQPKDASRGALCKKGEMSSPDAGEQAAIRRQYSDQIISYQKNSIVLFVFLVLSIAMMYFLSETEISLPWRKVIILLCLGCGMLSIAAWARLYQRSKCPKCGVQFLGRFGPGFRTSAYHPKGVKYCPSCGVHLTD